MNLLETMKSEIAELKLTDKLKIAQYIYIRTGELFEYDPLWIFSTADAREPLKHKKIDIKNVTDFNITCFSWARMYVELLHAFGIVARVKYVEDNFYGRQTLTLEPSTTHAYVEIIINGLTYVSDLTASYKDLVAIKLGLDTHYNSQLSKKFNEKSYHFNQVSDDIDAYRKTLKKTLTTIKEKLDSKRETLNNREFIFRIYKLIGSIIQFGNINTGYVTGTKSLEFLLNYFAGENYKPSTRYFFDNNKSIYIKVYEVPVNGTVHFFAYSKSSNGLYELQEVPREKIKLYSEIYQTEIPKISQVRTLKD